MEIPDETPMRIGEFVDGEFRPYTHPHRYKVEQTAGPDRLRIGSKTSPAETLAQLVELLEGKLFVMFALHMPKSDAEIGRYDDGLFSPAEAAAIVRDFADFIDNDARFDFWVGDPENTQLLVHDKHSITYAYGPLETFVAHLKSMGMVEGEVPIPLPHSHHYSDAYDEEERRLVASRKWRITELQDGDGD